MGEPYNLHGGLIHPSHAFFELEPLGDAGALVEILESSERWRKWQEWDARKRADKSLGGEEDG